MRTTTVLRVVHVMACAIGALAFGVAVWRWFLYRFPFESMPSLGELARFGGLITGLSLGLILLWGAVRLSPRRMKTTMILYVAWIGIFAWYWFNSFTLNELHSLDPEKIAQEQAQHTALSVGFFLLWTGLYLIGPILKARQRRH